MSKVKVGIIQMSCVKDKAANESNRKTGAVKVPNCLSANFSILCIFAMKIMIIFFSESIQAWLPKHCKLLRGIIR
jgi:hypothetical protein